MAISRPAIVRVSPHLVRHHCHLPPASSSISRIFHRLASTLHQSGLHPWVQCEIAATASRRLLLVTQLTALQPRGLRDFTTPPRSPTIPTRNTLSAASVVLAAALLIHIRAPSATCRPSLRFLMRLTASTQTCPSLLAAIPTTLPFSFHAPWPAPRPSTILNSAAVHSSPACGNCARTLHKRGPCGPSMRTRKARVEIMLHGPTRNGPAANRHRRSTNVEKTLFRVVPMHSPSVLGMKALVSFLPASVLLTLRLLLTTHSTSS